MSCIVWFDRYDPAQRLSLGGKCASLGEMTRAGLPVPPGFAVTTEAFQAAVRPSGLHAEIGALLTTLDIADSQALSVTAARARNMMAEIEFLAPVEDEIRTACARLDQLCAATDIPLAVRSSATCEDSPDASFAGEHDTYLWIRGADSILDHIRSCWASLYTDRGIAYRARMGHAHDTIEMCVGVQKMVRPIAAGVAFTLNPRDGDRSQIAIDSAWGFGEAVVSGEVTPDNFLVDKVLFEIVARQVSAKECEYALTDNDQMRRVELDGARSSAPSLTDAQIKAVARLARRAEKHYGHPQDVEWAVDADLPEDDHAVILLQSRPETVWSRKPRERVSAAGGDYLTSIVSTLTKPLHTRTGTPT